MLPQKPYIQAQACPTRAAAAPESGTCQFIHTKIKMTFLEGPYLSRLKACWVWIQPATIILLFVTLLPILTDFSLQFLFSLSREEVVVFCSHTKGATTSFK